MEHRKVKSQYVCVECGESASELYTDFKGGIIRIEHCKKCEKVVDKYVEYDEMIILLDLLLHKTQAYRHILYNIPLQAPWRLLCILLICDAYLFWDQERTDFSSQENKDDFIFIYAALEWKFYKMFIIAVIEWCIFNMCVISLYKIGVFLNKASNQKRWHSISRSLVISSFGKLLVIPATIWAQSHSPVYLVLTRLVILTSNAQALKVLCNLSSSTAFGLLIFANIVCIGFHSQLLQASLPYS